jgi:type II secretory pathway component GspD/PulD (secretin)
MQKAFNVLIAALLMCGAGFAQENTESVANIFNELMNYTAAPATAAVEQPTPVAAAPQAAVEVPVAAQVADTVEVSPAAAEESGGLFSRNKKEVVVEEPLPEPVVADAVAAAKPEAVVEAALEPTAAERFVQAQQGIEDAVKPRPENIAARMYPTTLMERDQRTTEIKSMKETKAAWATDLVFRSYALAGDACKKMGLEDMETATDVSGSFPQVEFPKGSSAIYQPKMKTLFVRNTGKNFAVLEAILSAMDLARLATDVDQVEIEAKFVEVSEGTLEELGFEWNFDNAVSANVGGSDVAIDDGANGLFANALRGSPSGSSPNLPFSRSSNIGGDGRVSASGDWAAFGITDTFASKPDSIKLRNNGSDPFDLLISALDQSTGADVLSAPRIVTRSGEEATIRVGELHSYPEVYEGDSDQATMINVSYQDFSEKLLGVELSVTPEVDGDQISLSLNPKITELAGWQNYQLAPANSIYNHRQLAKWAPYTHPAVIAKLPIFKKREIEAEVTIADGSTIGMGGLINEKIEAFEDKVPVLGSIPLIGRLFRNEGERAVKRNLLMFVTAKKVEASGRINTSRLVE